MDNPCCSAAAPLPFQKLFSDVLGDTLTVAAILTEAAELWREVTGVVAWGPEADAWDTINELLGGPELLESEFVSETLSNVRKRGIDLAQNAPHNYVERHPEAVSSTDAIQRYAGHTCHWLLKHGMKLASGLVQGVGKEATHI